VLCSRASVDKRPDAQEEAPHPGQGANANRRRVSISEDRPETEDSLSLAQQIEINLAEPRQDHRVVKLACRRIAGAG
jgi:hypothetical protein